MEISTSSANAVLATGNATLNGGSVVKPEAVNAFQNVSELKSEPVASTQVTLSSLETRSIDGIAGVTAEPTVAEKELMETPSSSTLAHDEETAATERVASEDAQIRNGKELTEEQVRVVDQLELRDREVRAHEQAHAAVGGTFAGAPSYDFSRGPDGRLYATAGEVSIDTSTVPGNPQATIDKMQTVIQAANAPAEPSGADRQVAAKAAAILAEALGELAQLREQQRTEQDTESEETADQQSAESSLGKPETDQEKQQIELEQRPKFEFVDSPFPPDPDIITSLAEITEARASLDQLLIDSGVYDRTFPTGSVIENIV